MEQLGFHNFQHRTYATILRRTYIERLRHASEVQLLYDDDDDEMVFKSFSDLSRYHSLFAFWRSVLRFVLRFRYQRYPSCIRSLSRFCICGGRWIAFIFAFDLLLARYYYDRQSGRLLMYAVRR